MCRGASVAPGLGFAVRCPPAPMTMMPAPAAAGIVTGVGPPEPAGRVAARLAAEATGLGGR